LKIWCHLLCCLDVVGVELLVVFELEVGVVAALDWCMGDDELFGNLLALLTRSLLLNMGLVLDVKERGLLEVLGLSVG
jgi:hypothetical protein